MAFIAFYGLRLLLDTFANLTPSRTHTPRATVGERELQPTTRDIPRNGILFLVFHFVSYKPPYHGHINALYHHHHRCQA